MRNFRFLGKFPRDQAVARPSVRIPQTRRYEESWGYRNDEATGVPVGARVLLVGTRGAQAAVALGSRLNYHCTGLVLSC
jgi:hypothetical protein